MTEKELRKLHRQDLLELLVEQSREASRLSAALDEKEQECREITENNERLKAKLDEKDAGLAQHTAASAAKTKPPQSPFFICIFMPPSPVSGRPYSLTCPHP